MGYDLKQLFVGAEGTLGIVTAAALRLTRAWRRVETALVGVGDPGAALELLAVLRGAIGDRVVACELLQRWGVELATAAVPTAAMPLADPQPWYVLVEVATAAADPALRDGLEAALAAMLDAGLVRDAVIAENEAQRQALWRLREALVEGKRRAGPGIEVDVAVPPGAVPAFLAQAVVAAETVAPGSRPLAFGHVGDGNVHFSVHERPDGAPLPREALTAAMHALVLGLGGSICAEHGVGRKMRAAVAEAVSPVERGLAATIKRAIDPRGIMNPGAVFAPGGEGG